MRKAPSALERALNPRARRHVRGPSVDPCYLPPAPAPRVTPFVRIEQVVGGGSFNRVARDARRVDVPSRAHDDAIQHHGDTRDAPRQRGRTSHLLDGVHRAGELHDAVTDNGDLDAPAQRAPRSLLSARRTRASRRRDMSSARREASERHSRDVTLVEFLLELIVLVRRPRVAVVVVVIIERVPRSSYGAPSSSSSSRSSLVLIHRSSTSATSAPSRTRSSCDSSSSYQTSRRPARRPRMSARNASMLRYAAAEIQPSRAAPATAPAAMSRRVGRSSSRMVRT